MTGLILTSISISSMFLFPLMAQPLSLGLSIMISTLFLCSLTAATLSAWYGYILFLIYVGGLLVMFAYVAALSPNMLFSGMGPLVFFSLAALFLMSTLYFYPFVDLGSLDYLHKFASKKTLKKYGTQLVSDHSAFVLIALGIILLINLVVVVKICYYQHSSLRPFD
uniref:NADH dehydrogenase subunit 6 n=1 Tax=Littoraria ardouiniana TaxID=684680 RepID=UPI002182269C|nr:NADH dehydrogenase subunit 6 [Littoraria ardouiniana]UVH65786.1 NADH dehydrogenase subunit 6 [Littoraria ardouiniana]